MCDLQPTYTMSAFLINEYRTIAKFDRWYRAMMRADPVGYPLTMASDDWEDLYVRFREGEFRKERVMAND